MKELQWLQALHRKANKRSEELFAQLRMEQRRLEQAVTVDAGPADRMVFNETHGSN